MNSVLTLISEQSWQQPLLELVNKADIDRLSQYLDAELKVGKVIFPKQEDWFAALNRLPLKNVNVVILGQDPYHGPNQAQGLSFSVPEHCKLPPSLRNIFKELQTDLSVTNENGDLNRWLEQGVLLLNSVLTVESGKAGSHAKRGWEQITDGVISIINEQLSNVVFLLWGNYAQSKRSLIDENKHLILTAAHPSPLSAYRGWFGSRNFSKTNEFLERKGKTKIDWNSDTASQISLL